MSGPLSVRPGLGVPTSLSCAASTVSRAALQANPEKPFGPSISSQKKVPVHMAWCLATATLLPLGGANGFQNPLLAGSSGPSRERFQLL